MLDFYDTATEPTPRMRQAMADAEVGDDVYGLDPTVRQLEEKVAALLGHEQGVLVASGTMGNLAAVLAQAARGTEAIIGADSHLLFYEAGGLAAVAGVMPMTVPTPGGVLTAEAVRAVLRAEDEHYPRTSLIAVENTHNRAGGTFTTVAEMDELAELARERQLALHVDGARLFNAAVAQSVAPADLARQATTVAICLSKGLSAPVGGVVVGSDAVIGEVRRARKLLGGSMRQAGVIAAAGIVAIDEGIDRLADDHARARSLADRLAHVPTVTVTTPVPATNFVMVDTSPSGLSAKQVTAALRERGIRASARPPSTVRFVTHRQIDDADIATLVDALAHLTD